VKKYILYTGELLKWNGVAALRYSFVLACQNIQLKLVAEELGHLPEL
jgi:hypothetical protein